MRGLAQKYGADKVVLFGSRARGDAGERSDYDVVFYGELSNVRGVISDKANWESPTLNKIDCLFEGDFSGKIIDNIQRDGVIIYESRKI